LIAFLVLAGCAIDSAVQTVSTSNTTFEDVQVIRLTPSVARQANASPYTPRNLPHAFAVGGVTPRAPVEPASNPWPTNQRIPDYRIGVGDVLLVTAPTPLFSTNRSTPGVGQGFQAMMQVDTSGMITLSDIGGVAVSGLMLADARVALQTRFQDRTIDPQFELSVAEFNARRATVSGAVRQPFVVPLSLTPISFSEALAEAGGVAVDDPAGVRVRLLRDRQVFEVGLIEFTRSPALGQVSLRDGDQLVVITDAGADALRAQADATLRNDSDRRERFAQQEQRGAIERDYVYITGEVEQQRSFILPFGTRATLANALLDEARGVQRGTGNPAEIYLIRIQGNDRIVAYHLSASNAADLALATMMELRPDDIVFVSERPIATWNRILQALFPSAVFGIARVSSS
jgi:polysaccharide export outer membrane protein